MINTVFTPEVVDDLTNHFPTKERRRPCRLTSNALPTPSREPSSYGTPSTRSSPGSGRSLDDLDAAEITFTAQVDRQGNRQATKTDGSARVVPIPRELAAVLARHKLASVDTRPSAYVFATRTGRPLAQRNVTRALRQAQTRAVTPEGTLTFPILHEHGQPVPVPRGAVPPMHSFRHTYVSRWLLAGESVDEVAFLLRPP